MDFVWLKYCEVSAQGKQTFTDGFRVLFAGGGTGNSVCFMGEQLRNSSAEVLTVQGDHFSKIYLLGLDGYICLSIYLADTNTNILVSAN